MAGAKAKVRDITLPEVKAKLDRVKAITSMRDAVKAEDRDKLVMKAYSEKLTAAEIEALAEYSLAPH